MSDRLVEITQKIRDFHEKEGRPPTVRELEKGGVPRRQLYTAFPGGLVQACEVAGVPISEETRKRFEQIEAAMEARKKAERGRKSIIEEFEEFKRMQEIRDGAEVLNEKIESYLLALGKASEELCKSGADGELRKKLGRLIEQFNFIHSKCNSVLTFGDLEELKVILRDLASDADGLIKIYEEWREARRVEAEERARAQEMERIRKCRFIIHQIAGEHVPGWVLDRFTFKSEYYAQLYAQATMIWLLKFVKNVRRGLKKKLWEMFLENFREGGERYLHLIVYGPQQPCYPYYGYYPIYYGP